MHQGLRGSRTHFGKSVVFNKILRFLSLLEGNFTSRQKPEFFAESNFVHDLIFTKALEFRIGMKFQLNNRVLYDGVFESSD